MKIKNKIILIRPWNEYHISNYPPLNLIMLATVLRDNGFDAKIVHCEDERLWKDKLNEEINDNVIAIGLTALTSEIRSAITIANYLKTRTSVPVIWGGWHSTLFPEQMSESSLVDYVITGEGDFSFCNLVKEIRDGIKSSKRIINSNRIELDKVPMPAYDIDGLIEHFIAGKLSDKLQELVNGKFRWLPYQSSRGCPHRCGFCINVVTNNQVYKKKATIKVLDELEYIAGKFDITHIKFIDDNLFVDINSIKEIALGLLKRGIMITWDAECRVDYFQEGRIGRSELKLFKESGLVQLTFGVESGSERSLEIMKKDIKPSQAIAAVALCDSLGIISRCSFILDVPGESRDDLYKTANFIRELRKFKRCVWGVHTYRPYPKSELCQNLIDDAVIFQPNSLNEWNNPEYVSQFTSTDALRKWQRNYKVSSKISFYLSLESAMWLKPHQIRHKYVKVLNNIFIFLAKIRNITYFYFFDLDRAAYILLKNWYYKKISN